MNPNLMRVKNQTKNLLISSTENCEKLIKQFYTKPQETLNFKLTKSRQTFRFKLPISIQGSRMLGLTSLEAYNTIFNMTEENNKFELCTDTFDEFSFAELEDELEDMLNNSDITPKNPNDDTMGPRNIQVYGKLGLEKSSTDGYFIWLLRYARPPFRDFESYLRIVISLYEDDIQLILEQYNANFITNELDTWFLFGSRNCTDCVRHEWSWRNPANWIWWP